MAKHRNAIRLPPADNRARKRIRKTPSALESEEPLVNPYRAWSRLCWWLALGSLVIGATATAATLALATDKALFVFPLGLGAAGLLCTVIGALTYAYYAPMVDRHLDEFRRGEYLAHWTYEPGEWARFAEAELAGKREEAVMVLIVFGVVGASILDLIGSAVVTRPFGGAAEPVGAVAGNAEAAR